MFLIRFSEPIFATFRIAQPIFCLWKALDNDSNTCAACGDVVASKALVDFDEPSRWASLLLRRVLQLYLLLRISNVQYSRQVIDKL